MYHEIAFPPPDKIWSTNEDRNLNPYTRAERIKSWKFTTQLAWASYCNRCGLTRALGESLVRVSIPFRQRRVRDPHNYCGTVVKAVIDGLVLAGAWEDDNEAEVEHLSPVLPVGGEQIVVVSIIPRRPAHFACDHGAVESCDVEGCDGGIQVQL